MEIRDLSFIHKYFLAEKQESFVFLIIGGVSVIAAIVFFFFIKNNPSFFKGAALPLLVIGLVQLAAGYTVYSRTDKQRMDVAYKMGMEPVRYTQSDELPRMQQVMKRFAIFRWVEILCFVGGLLLVFLLRKQPEKAFWYGLGLALAIQAAITFTADTVAERRGETYTGELLKIVGPDPVP